MKKYRLKKFGKRMSGNNVMSFLIFMLFQSWETAIQYNIQNILKIPDREFNKLKGAYGGGKHNSKSIIISNYIGKNLSQDFRNFFYLKNISKENFDKYIHFINFSQTKEKFSYSQEKFTAYYNDSKYWTQKQYSHEEKKKLALCDAIQNIWYDIYIAKNNKIP